MGIEPDDTYVYAFRLSKEQDLLVPASHSGLQEQEGIRCRIIDAGSQNRFTYDREHVVMLSGWTDENHSQPAEKLKTVGLLRISINQPLALFRY